MAEVSLQSIETLEADIIRKRDAKIQAAQAEAERALDALRIVAEMLRGDAQPTLGLGILAQAAERAIKNKVNPTARWVKSIISELNGVIISQPLIFEKLIEKHPEISHRDPTNVRSQISMILKKMEVKGDLILHKAPYGSNPTEYRKRPIRRDELSPNEVDEAIEVEL